MTSTTTEGTEVANGKGVYQESLHSGSQSQGAVGNDLNAKWWNNEMTDADEDNDMKGMSFNAEYKNELEYEKMMSEMNTGDDTWDEERRTQYEQNDRQRMEEHKMQEEKRKQEEERQHKREQDDQMKVQEWLRSINMYGRVYVPPTPKHLIIRDVGRRRFSDENVMRRTAWLGMALDITSREQLPAMKRIVLKEKPCITVTVEDPDMAKKLLQTTQLGQCQVQIEKDPIKNTVSGVLHDKTDYFRNLSLDAMVNMLSEHGVQKVSKLGRDESKSYRLVFDGLTCPDGLGFDDNWFVITKFVPSPLRCYKCQKYDHAEKSCRKTESECVCQRCGEVGHRNKYYAEETVINECRKARRCMHCNGDHEAGFRKCPTQISYKKVNELMVYQNLSRYEAKTRVFQHNNSYTAARVLDTAVQLEHARNREKTDKTELQALSMKVDKLMERLVPSVSLSPSRDATDPLEQRIQDAVTAATQQLKKDTNSRLAEFEQKLQAQETTISDLTKRNQQLEQEATDLKNQLAAAEQDKKKLQQQLQAHTLTVKPPVVRKRSGEGNPAGGQPNKVSAMGSDRKPLPQVTQPHKTERSNSNLKQADSRSGAGASGGSRQQKPKPTLLPKPGATNIPGQPQTASST